MKIAIHGAAGRMGRQLVLALSERDDAELIAALDAENSPALGIDSGVLAGGGENGIVIASGAVNLPDHTDVVIDFSLAPATARLVPELAERQIAMVIGTTGLDRVQQAAVAHASARSAIVQAPNYSVGVTVLFELLREATRALGERYDIEIIEAHHRHKVDAPSGTAVRMGEIVAQTLQRDLASVAVYGREGITGERHPDTIGFATVRAGDIIGEHTALFAAQGERLELTHRAGDRLAFARGAVQAAVWAGQQSAGLYDMRDVLGMRDQLRTGAF